MKKSKGHDADAKNQFDATQDDDEPEIERETVSIHRFFKYNDRKDNLMLFVGTFGAVIAGLLIPSIAMIMGSIAQSFGESGMDLGMMSDKVQ